MDKTTVGYIGLGHAGYPMAACLAKKGYKLVVHDQDATPAHKFVQEFPECRLACTTPATTTITTTTDDDDAAGGGAGGTALVRDAFASCEIVMTMLPNGKIVREVLLGGENGVAWGLQPGSIIVDTSSSSPFDTQQLGQDLRPLSLALVDAPITQRALHAIDTGGATLMVGADDEAALGRVLPVLRDMSLYVFPMGKLGAGHTMKTLNNYVSVGSIIALCDALVTGQKLGLDPQTMINVMNVGTGVNFSTAYSMRRLKSFDSGYQLALLVKDVQIAQDVIAQAGFATELPALALRYLEDGLALVDQGACHSECLRSWERRAGVEIKKTEGPVHQ